MKVFSKISITIIRLSSNVDATISVLNVCVCVCVDFCFPLILLLMLVFFRCFGGGGLVAVAEKDVDWFGDFILWSFKL